MRFCTMTLGCKANQYDTGTIEDILRLRGHEQVRQGEGCDVCIINTCAVTAESIRKSRQAVRRMKKREPGAVIAVCGCFPQLERDAVAALGADIIGGTGDREGFAEEIEKHYIQTQKNKLSNPACTLKHADILRVSSVSPVSRTRALLKIQDGCDNRCAYCVIPYARGCSRSVPLNELAQKAQELSERDYKEIVITGIEISSYSHGLIEALRIIGSSAPGARLRLGSLCPDILTEQFIRQLRSIPRLCNHFHISLQSGCDGTLARMGRKYNTEQTEQAIAGLRNAFDNCGVTADLIVGFPGETEKEFGQTLSFIEKAAFSAMHIFPYSARQGTPAAVMTDQISSDVKRQRAAIAAKTAKPAGDSFKRAQIGRILEVLFERQRGAFMSGHSGNYLTVAVTRKDTGYGKIDKNTLAKVKISSIKDNDLWGEIV